VPKEIKPTEKVTITSNIISIKGFTASGSSLDNWLSALKVMKWIKKFEIVSIKKDKKNIQQFELKIFLNNV
jgi:Tfp pilus assembly protein PilN